MNERLLRLRRKDENQSFGSYNNETNINMSTNVNEDENDNENEH